METMKLIQSRLSLFILPLTRSVKLYRRIVMGKYSRAETNPTVLKIRNSTRTRDVLFHFCILYVRGYLIEKRNAILKQKYKRLPYALAVLFKGKSFAVCCGVGVDLFGCMYIHNVFKLWFSTGMILYERLYPCWMSETWTVEELIIIILYVHMYTRWSTQIRTG